MLLELLNYPYLGSHVIQFLDIKAIMRLLSTSHLISDTYAIKNIKSLSIKDNDLITDNALRYFTGLTDIELINCSRITATCLQYYPLLEKADFSYTKASKKGMKYLGPLVKELKLCYCPHINHGSFKYFNNVLNLDIKGCKVQRKSFRYISHVETLNDIKCNGILDKDFSYLKNVKNIFTSENDITDKCLQHLENVNTICLKNCSRVTDDGLKYLTKVKNICLHDCNNITDDGLQYLVNVVNIDLSNCMNVYGFGFHHLKNVKENSLVRCDIDMSYINDLKAEKINLTNSVLKNAYSGSEKYQNKIIISEINDRDINDLEWLLHDKNFVTNVTSINIFNHAIAEKYINFFPNITNLNIYSNVIPEIILKKTLLRFLYYDIQPMIICVI